MRSISLPAVYLVTDRRRLSPDARTLDQEVTALERLIDDAVAAEIDVIQIRESEIAAALLLALVQRVCRRVRGTRTRIVVNDRADVALIGGADGVHLPSHGISVAAVRSAMGTQLIGCSTHADTKADKPMTADYVLFGTVFQTRSKPGLSVPAGLSGLGVAARTFQVPMFAIGGVTPERAAACIRAGSAGVAAIAPFLPAGREPGSLGTARAIAAFRETMAAGWKCSRSADSCADLLE